MTIQVTQEDIDNGAVGRPCHCPIALAVKRQYTSATDEFYPWIDDESLTLMKDGDLEVAYFRLPSEATDFIFSFDYGITVEPFEFEIAGLEPNYYAQL